MKPIKQIPPLDRRGRLLAIRDQARCLMNRLKGMSEAAYAANTPNRPGADQETKTRAFREATEIWKTGDSIRRKLLDAIAVDLAGVVPLVGLVSPDHYWGWGDNEKLRWGEIEQELARIANAAEAEASRPTVSERVATEPVGTPTAKASGADDPARVGLTPKEEAILNVLPGEDSPMLGRDVIIKLGREGVTSDLSELSRLCKKPPLSARGVRNRRGAGYYKLNTI